jgi:hypothetical protein
MQMKVRLKEDISTELFLKKTFGPLPPSDNFNSDAIRKHVLDMNIDVDHVQVKVPNTNGELHTFSYIVEDKGIWEAV